jgi:hypothetical protein
MYGPMPISAAIDGNATSLAANSQLHLTESDMLPFTTVTELSARVSDIMFALGDREGGASTQVGTPPTNSPFTPAQQQQQQQQQQQPPMMNSSFQNYAGGQMPIPPPPPQVPQVPSPPQRARVYPFCYRVGPVNVIDPLYGGNNLAAAVDANGLSVLRHASARGLSHFAELIKELCFSSENVISDNNLLDEENREEEEEGGGRGGNQEAIRASVHGGSGGDDDDDLSIEESGGDDDDGHDEEEERETYHKMSKIDGKLLIHEFGDSACRNLFPRTWEMYGDGFRPDLRSGGGPTHGGGGGGGMGNMSNHSTSAHIYPAHPNVIRESSSDLLGGSSSSEHGSSSAVVNSLFDQEGNVQVGSNGYAKKVHLEGRSLLTTATTDADNAARHAELVLASKVNADALARLVVGIIQATGPLPVGEVGKQLQEATGNVGLSAMLKVFFSLFFSIFEALANVSHISIIIIFLSL